MKEIKPFVDEALKLTIKNSDFMSYQLSENEFASLLKSAELICQKVFEILGEEGLDNLCNELRKRQEWQAAAELFESLCFDFDD